MPNVTLGEAATDLARLSEFRGLTAQEAAEFFGSPLPAAALSLSALHKARTLRRLAECRNGSGVYVLPEFVDGRRTVAAEERHMAGDA